VPGLQMGGIAISGLASNQGGTGTSLQGTIMLVTYEGSLASWPAPQFHDFGPSPEHVNPGPQSASAVHGPSHCGAHVLPIWGSQRVPGPQSESLWQGSERQVSEAPPSALVPEGSQSYPRGQSAATEQSRALASRAENAAEKNTAHATIEENAKRLRMARAPIALILPRSRGRRPKAAGAQATAGGRRWPAPTSASAKASSRTVRHDWAASVFFCRESCTFE
jgi:hypothetical protein